jgi:ribosomal protein S12 methylthiotransferase accessory factor
MCFWLAPGNESLAMTKCHQEYTIGLLGSGLLFRSIWSQLGEHAYQCIQINDEDLAVHSSSCSLLLVVEDSWHAQRHMLVNQHSLQQRIPWLRVSVTFGTSIMGPCIFPWESGCSTCAETRRVTAMEDADDSIQMSEYLRTSQRDLHSPWLTAYSIELLTALVVQEVDRFFHSPERLVTRNALLYLALASLSIHLSNFLPDPVCVDCSHLPEDTAGAAVIELQARRKLTPSTYRIRSLSAEIDVLHTLYVNKETGIIRRIVRDSSNLYANVSAHLGLNHGRSTEIGLGRSLSFGVSQGAAIAEALERYAGMQPYGKRTAVRASYRQLGDQALDPTTLGLYAPEQYTLPNFPCIPYHHDLVCTWVWGYSLIRAKPVLVPECYAYYGLQKGEGKDRSFVYEISNGCAIGSCLEEAILYGLLEVAERDAFLLTWYARLQVPQIDLFSARNHSIPLLIERIRHRTGYTVYAFNITVEQGIPCCCVLGIDEEQRPYQPRAICAAGSHIHPEKALANALQELAPLTVTLARRYRDKREHALAMLDNPFAVKRMEDHTLLYCLPEAFSRLSFLFASSQIQTFQEAFPDFYRHRESTDLADDLQQVIERYCATGLDIVVVDQTTPEQMAGNFRCVKVIVPGALPMAFGYATRRLTGLPRLYRVPSQPGYSMNPLTDSQLNPHPHPFP